MSKIVIDVALLLSDKIMDICININKKDPNAYSRLNKKDNLPHISLAMGAVEKENISKIKDIIREISNNYNDIRLKITKISYIITPDNTKSYQLNFEENIAIKKLHAEIMDKLFPFFFYDISQKMFYRENNEKIDRTSMHWVKTYREKRKNPEKFDPHISLKCAKANYNKFPIKFTALKLAVCHMGKHGTCRRILFSINLNNK